MLSGEFDLQFLSGPIAEFNLTSKPAAAITRKTRFTIAAAEVFTYLGAICPLQKPAHEGQLRPLVGLTREQAQLAWEQAAKKAGNR